MADQKGFCFFVYAFVSVCSFCSNVWVACRCVSPNMRVRYFHYCDRLDGEECFRDARIYFWPRKAGK